MDFFNKTVIKDAWIKSFRLNRREFAFNVSVETKIPFDRTINKVTLKTRAYKKIGPDYRLKLLDFDLDLCDTIKRDFYKVVVNPRYIDGAPFNDCPVRTMQIVAFNQKFDGSTFPPNIPTGSYRLEEQFYLHKTFLGLSISLYIEVTSKKKDAQN